MGPSFDAVVVGSGPNGLTAAATLARAGLSVRVLEAADTPGGGTRTAELTLPGFRHDICSAVHPFGITSPAFAALGLTDLGLTWRHSEIDVAHPLDDGSAAVLHRDIGRMDDRWRRVFGGPTRMWPRVKGDFLRDPLHLPRHPLGYLRFGTQALPPATAIARLLGDDATAALWMGIAAHVVASLRTPLSSAAGLGFVAAGHNDGWPVAVGGSQAIADALVACVEAHGGTIECGRRVRTFADLPPARVTLFDTTPTQLVRIADGAIPRSAYRRFTHGPAAFKIDYALDGPVPWTSPEARRAATVHLGGPWREVDAAEQAVARGRIADRPFVLAAQQSICDDTRAPAGRHTLWAYCHVPNGCTVDVTDRLEAQIDRFAPGWRDLVLARHVTRPADLEAHNENDIGGDFAGGSNAGLRWLFRPQPARDPYRTPVDGVFLCSASTPPGGGVHGSCGWNAAHSALHHLGHRSMRTS